MGWTSYCILILHRPGACSCNPLAAITRKQAFRFAVGSVQALPLDKGTRGVLIQGSVYGGRITGRKRCVIVWIALPLIVTLHRRGSVLRGMGGSC